MLLKTKVGLVQAFFGAIVLTLLMVPMGIAGYGSYTWMLFLPLLLFFAFGAQFKLIPSMILSYVCGILWAIINGAFAGLLGRFMPPAAVNIAAPIVIIFCILTVHENLLANTIVGNVPSLFLGMASTFFVFMIKPANAPAITPIHLVVFFIYGIVLSVALAGGGFAVCSAVFGKEKVMSVFAEKGKDNAKCQQ